MNMSVLPAERFLLVMIGIVKRHFVVEVWSVRALRAVRSI